MLPQSHPSVNPGDGKSCPVTGIAHEFRSPQPSDVRSVCPALNTMANHGYIARDGKNLSALDISRGLQACYGLSTPLALFLSYVGYFMIGKRFGRASLFEIGIHQGVEHDASLVHHDTPKGLHYAPIEIDKALVDKLMADVQTPGDKTEKGGEDAVMSAEDVARARVRREKESPPLDAVHSELARGEMAIILGVFQQIRRGKTGAPVEWMRPWISEERLPQGWAPDHTEGLISVVTRARTIRNAMEKIKQAKAT